jgi:signal transduction histidine kinase
MTVSVTVLAGWAFDLALLKGLGGAITMKANAAVALFASGIALFSINSTRPARRTLGRIGASVAALLGSLTLSEHLFGWNLGIDEFLVREAPGAAATTSPGRMGPNASLSLTLAGIAVWSLYRGSARAIALAQLLGACIATLALIPLVGYLYGATQLYAIARYTGIAIHTGIALLILGIGIVAAYPTTGPVAALMSDAPYGAVSRRLLVQAVALPLILGYVELAGERHDFYDARFGTGAFVVAMIVLLSITTWRTAVALSYSEDARRTAQRERDDLLVSERAARERAERADRAKDEFIASLSHELRTPLNAIMGWTHMLRDGSVAEPNRGKAFDAVSRNADVLARLIRDLLDTSRIATGRLELSKAPADINAIVQAAVESVTPAADTKRLTLTVSPAPHGVIVLGDAQRLQQVLWNILSNAVKFTPESGRVGVHVHADDHAVRVQIRDDGEGIEPAFLPRVFDRFEQGSARRENGSMGLGLHIAKSLVEAHGGDIHVHSDGIGRGAVFTVQLPLAEHNSRAASSLRWTRPANETRATSDPTHAAPSRSDRNWAG